MNLQKTIDSNYQNLVKEILNTGYLYDDPNRKGVKRKEIASYTFRHEFKDGFPAITLKKLAWKSVVTELLWFLRGDTNIKYLVDNGCNIWNKDAYNYYLKHYQIFSEEPLSFKDFINNIKDPYFKPENFTTTNYAMGDLGRVYGAQWRNWKGSEQNEYTVEDHERPFYMDQISSLIRGLIKTPMSTQHIVNAWNPAELDNMALPPCHYGFQVVVRPLNLEERLGNNSLDNLLEEYSEEEIAENLDYDNIPKYGFELHWKQRSCDLFLGKIWELLK